MTMNWEAFDLFGSGLIQVVDGGVSFVAQNPEGKTPELAARDYGEFSPDQNSRQITVRAVQEWGCGPWETHTVPYVAPPPLVHLDWMGSNPQGNGPWVHVVDNEESFTAPNPEEWDLQRCVDDYADAPVPGYEPRTPICFNREPHEVTARLNGGTLEPFDITPTNPFE